LVCAPAGEINRTIPRGPGPSGFGPLGAGHEETLPMVWEGLGRDLVAGCEEGYGSTNYL